MRVLSLKKWWELVSSEVGPTNFGFKIIKTLNDGPIVVQRQLPSVFDDETSYRTPDLVTNLIYLENCDYYIESLMSSGWTLFENGSRDDISANLSEMLHLTGVSQDDSAPIVYALMRQKHHIEKEFERNGNMKLAQELKEVYDRWVRNSTEIDEEV